MSFLSEQSWIKLPTNISSMFISSFSIKKTQFMNCAVFRTSLTFLCLFRLEYLSLLFRHLRRWKNFTFTNNVTTLTGMSLHSSLLRIKLTVLCSMLHPVLRVIDLWRTLNLMFMSLTHSSSSSVALTSPTLHPARLWRQIQEPSSGALVVNPS